MSVFCMRKWLDFGVFGVLGLVGLRSPLQGGWGVLGCSGRAGDVGTPLGTWVPPWGCGHPPSSSAHPHTEGAEGSPLFPRPPSHSAPRAGDPPQPSWSPPSRSPPPVPGGVLGTGSPLLVSPRASCRDARVSNSGVSGLLLPAFGQRSPWGCSQALKFKAKNSGIGTVPRRGGAGMGGGSTQGRCRDARRAGWKCPPKPPAPQHLPICRAPSL